MRLLRDQLTKPLTTSKILPASLVSDLYLPQTCDLWTPGEAGHNTDGEMLDPSPSRIATRVRCYFAPTPETDEAAIEGRTKVVNIFTLDKWFFGFDTIEPQDAWWIKLTSVGHPDVGHFWKIEGNSRTQYNGMHLVNRRMVYAKRGPPPKGIS